GRHFQLLDNPDGVQCNPPDQYPPQPQQLQQQDEFAAVTTPLTLLNEVMDTPQSDFQDSDGLISFVNLSSSFVTNNTEFKTGQTVCDKVANFFATLRQSVFTFLKKNPSKVLGDDTVPTTQWDPAVTHYMQFLLTQAGGLTEFVVTAESY